MRGMEVMRNLYYGVLIGFIVWVFVVIKPVASSVTRVFANHNWDSSDLAKSIIHEWKAKDDEESSF